MAFSIFKYIDASIVEQEKRTSRAATLPAVWPSEASAERIDKDVSKIVGNCMRKSYFRMTGHPISDQVDAVGAWRFTTGRMIENHLVDLAKTSKPNIYAANGVKTYVKEFYMPLELDLVVVDPEDNYRGWIAECKTIYGYMAGSEIMAKGKPKLENLIQDCLYLLEFPTGVKMKTAIVESLEYRARMKALGREGRHRIEADMKMVEKMDDGPIGAKLVYIARDDCDRREFNITIAEDYDGSHYPCVDGDMYRLFTIESIYQRFVILQDFWFRARQAAFGQLAKRGIHPPATLKLVLKKGDEAPRYDEDRQLTEADRKAEVGFMTALESEVRRLPIDFWPPAEYEWAYSADKIEALYRKGEIGNDKYNRWKGITPTGKKSKRKDLLSKIGDWNCLYCPFKQTCVPIAFPEWAFEVYDASKPYVDPTAAVEGDDTFRGLREV